MSRLNPARVALEHALQSTDEDLAEARDKRRALQSDLTAAESKAEQAQKALESQDAHANGLSEERRMLLQAINDIEQAESVRRDAQAQRDATLGVGI